MNLLQKLFLFISLFATLHCAGQAQTSNPIDAEYNACVAKDTSSGNICNCAFTAYDKWNREMDKSYGRLLKTLRNDKDKTALKQSQTAWMAYRDSEFRSYDNMFNLPGGRWCKLRQDGRIDVVRARSIQLQNYLAAFRSR